MSAYLILNALSHSPSGAFLGSTNSATGNLQLTKKTTKRLKTAR